MTTEDATSRFPFVTVEWVSKWPAEEIWKACKRACADAK